jgi:hypothetical protein
MSSKRSLKGLKLHPRSLETRNKRAYNKKCVILDEKSGFFLEPRFTVRSKPDRDPKLTNVDPKHCRINSVFSMNTGLIYIFIIRGGHPVSNLRPLPSHGTDHVLGLPGDGPRDLHETGQIQR